MALARAAAWLVQTKLRPPAPPVDLVDRPVLLGAVREALATRRLTLLSAPAGYGKTTLLASLPGALPEHAFAWLSLDEDDNDPNRFLAGLVAAVQQLDPEYAVTAATLLETSSRARDTDPVRQARLIVGALTNDLVEAGNRPTALVLDDLHTVSEPVVYAALDYLIERLPPAVHLLTGTRHDPPLALARLRARGQLSELRLQDLQFGLDETASFLNGQPGLACDAMDVMALQTRTEGWPAGLRILAGSLSQIGSSVARRSFIAHLPRADTYLFDFLAEEVLNLQEARVRRFLVESSILTELTPELCRAVTGAHDAGALLEDLRRRTLFVVAVDEAGTTLRYHDLFAEFLRQRLAREGDEHRRELHRRAGEAEPVPARAIDHLLAAELWPAAAALIVRVGAQLLSQGLLGTVRGWIEALPVEVRREQPRLLYLLGACKRLQGDDRTARTLLEEALESFEARGDRVGAGEALAELAAVARLQADFEQMGVTIDRALAGPTEPRTRVQLLMARVDRFYLSCDWRQAGADLQTAVRLTEENGDPEVLRTLVLHLIPAFAVLPAGFKLFERICGRAPELFAEPVSPLRLAVATQMQFVHLYRGRLDESLERGQDALMLSQRLGHLPTFETDINAMLAMALVGRGTYAAAETHFERLFHYIEQVPLYQSISAGFLYVLGRARWLEGRFKDARAVYAQMVAAAARPETPLGPPMRLMMHGLLELADRRFAAAERSFREAASIARSVPHVKVFARPELMLASLYAAWDRPDEALIAVKPVLAECEREGTSGYLVIEGASVIPALRLAVERGVHASFSAHVLDLVGGAERKERVRASDARATLTARELQILGQLAGGASNRSIATRLVISERTTKAHLYHIFRKLNVANRTEAVVRARELRLV
ncbi:MAG: AAA family ATPase [Chloroflexi bacterium]|nr:AAA family ATPase [Chloroflexota bacterium]